MKFKVTKELCNEDAKEIGKEVAVEGNGEIHDNAKSSEILLPQETKEARSAICSILCICT